MNVELVNPMSVFRLFERSDAARPQPSPCREPGPESDAGQPPSAGGRAGAPYQPRRSAARDIPRLLCSETARRTANQLLKLLDPAPRSRRAEDVLLA
jgi:hypothetical protein